MNRLVPSLINPKDSSLSRTGLDNSTANAEAKNCDLPDNQQAK